MKYLICTLMLTMYSITVISSEDISTTGEKSPIVMSPQGNVTITYNEQANNICNRFASMDYDADYQQEANNEFDTIYAELIKLFQNSRLKEAEAELERAIEKSNRSDNKYYYAKFNIELALIYLNTNRPSLAESLLKKIATTASQLRSAELQSRVLYSWGDQLLRLKQKYDEASVCFIGALNRYIALQKAQNYKDTINKLNTIGMRNNEVFIVSERKYGTYRRNASVRVENSVCTKLSNSDVIHGHASAKSNSSTTLPEYRNIVEDFVSSVILLTIAENNYCSGRISNTKTICDFIRSTCESHSEGSFTNDDLYYFSPEQSGMEFVTITLERQNATISFNSNPNIHSMMHGGVKRVWIPIDPIEHSEEDLLKALHRVGVRI